jgi:hypothetical protein
MSRRLLNFLIVILVVALAAAVWSSERGVSGVMERMGSTISRLFD